MYQLLHGGWGVGLFNHTSELNIEVVSPFNFGELSGPQAVTLVITCNSLYLRDVKRQLVPKVIYFSCSLYAAYK
jgi:hypothetical protein